MVTEMKDKPHLNLERALPRYKQALELEAKGLTPEQIAKLMDVSIKNFYYIRTKARQARAQGLI